MSSERREPPCSDEAKNGGAAAPPTDAPAAQPPPEVLAELGAGVWSSEIRMPDNLLDPEAVIAELLRYGFANMESWQKHALGKSTEGPTLSNIAQYFEKPLALLVALKKTAGGAGAPLDLTALLASVQQTAGEDDE